MTTGDEKIVRRYSLMRRLKKIPTLLILVGILVLLVGQIRANKSSIERTNQQIQSFNVSQKQQTEDITNATNIIRDQSDLIICLLQLESGRDFTERAECQRRTDQATKQFMSGQPVTPVPPSSTFSPQPTLPPPNCILIICVYAPTTR